jgi:hypothetical protein
MGLLFSTTAEYDFHAAHIALVRVIAPLKGLQYRNSASLEPALQLCNCAKAARFRATTAGATIGQDFHFCGLLGLPSRGANPRSAQPL